MIPSRQSRLRRLLRARGRHLNRRRRHRHSRRHLRGLVAPPPPPSRDPPPQALHYPLRSRPRRPTFHRPPIPTPHDSRHVRPRHLLRPPRCPHPPPRRRLPPSRHQLPQAPQHDRRRRKQYNNFLPRPPPHPLPRPTRPTHADLAPSFVTFLHAFPPTTFTPTEVATLRDVARSCVPCQ